MSCCGLCCKMPKRNDYKVSTVEIELEPLGGDKAEPKKNGVNNRIGKFTYNILNLIYVKCLYINDDLF